MPPWPRLGRLQRWQCAGHVFLPAGEPHVCALARRFRPLWTVAQQVKGCQCAGAAHRARPATGQEELQEPGFFASCWLGRGPGP